MNESSRVPSHHQKRGAISLIIAILFLLFTSVMVMAGWVTIDTDDYDIDPNWATVTPVYVATSNDTSIDDRNEIKQAWFVYDGDYLAFRIDVQSPGAFLSDDNKRVIAALDCNHNGSFRDGDSGGNFGDRAIILYPWERVDLTDGTGSITVYSSSSDELADIDGGSGEWKIAIKRIYPNCRGLKEAVPVMFSIIDKNSAATPISQAPADGDPPYSYYNPMDFGDAPNDVQWQNNDFQCSNYDTKMPCDGPRHGMTSLQLGSNIDPDAGELADAPALADDTNYSDDPDDEDGVSPSPGVTWTAGGTGSLDVSVAGGNGYLNCWIDWDRDETFETGEHVINDVAVNAGTTTLSINVSGSVTFDGPYMARCRLTPNAGEGTSPTGPVWGGEVEDNDWLIQPADLNIAINGSDVDLTWSHLAQNDSEQAYKSSTPYFDRVSASTLGSACTSGNCTTSDAGVVGGTPDAIYYKVYGQADVSGTTIYATPSKEVGLFEFRLVPGTN